MLGTFRKILVLLSRRERRRFFVLVLMVLFMGILEAVGVASIFPFLAVLSDPSVVEKNELLASAYRFGGFDDQLSFLVALGGAVFLVIVVGLAFKTVTFYAVIRFGHMRTYTLGHRMFKSYLAQPYFWFLSHHSAHLAKNILSEVDEVVNRTVIPAVRIISFSVIAFFIIAVLVIADPLVAFSIAGIIGGCYAGISLFTRKYLLRIGRDRERANAERFHVAQECFGGIKHVKLMGLEQVFIKRFQGAAIRLGTRRASGDVLSETPRYVLEAMLLGGILIVVMVKLIASGGHLGQSLPIIGLYAFAGARLFPAAQMIYRSVAHLRFGQPALEALVRDLESLPVPRLGVTTDAASGEVTPLRLRRSLELESVCYAYPGTDRRAVDDVSIAIEANTTVAFVGKTGSGKTTIVDLILGMLEPQRGRVLVDGAAIDDSNVKRWQRTLGYVPQDIFLADDTVSGNIAFGVPRDLVDKEAMESAARIAELHDFVVTELASGYDTHIGERGIRLSGGQRQRIGIARALYHNPDLLVLDEATSALDNQTERAVMDAVHNLAKAKTIILVAHRLSTVRECDRIFLVERGYVVAAGTYEQLIDQNEQFRALAGR